jgi:hypothetical protein
MLESPNKLESIQPTDRTSEEIDGLVSLNLEDYRRKDKMRKEDEMN